LQRPRRLYSGQSSIETKRISRMTGESTRKNISHVQQDVNIVDDSFSSTKEKYQRIINYLKTEFFFYTYNADNSFSYVSPSVENLLGYSPKVFSQTFKKIWTNSPLNDEAAKKSALIRKGNRQLPFQLEVHHQNGSTCQLIVSETPVLGGNGELVAVEGIARDISEKLKFKQKFDHHNTYFKKLTNQHTEELENLRKQLFDIIDFLPDPTYVVDKLGKIIAWNPAIEKMSGLKKANVLGTHFRGHMSSFYETNNPLLIDLLGSDLEKINLQDEKINSKNGILSTERHLPGLHDGEGGHVHITTGAIVDQTGQFAGAIESIRDMIEIQMVEKRIRHNEQRLSAVMHNLPGMAYRIVKEDTWKMEFVSKGSRMLTGYEPEYFENQNLTRFFDLIHRDDIDNVEKEFQAAIDTKRTFNAEFRIISSSGGTRWVFTRAEGATFDYEGSVRIEGFIADFTTFKEMEQQLREENLLLRSNMQDRYKFGNIIGNSKAMQDVYDLILKAATTSDSVFIFGDSGTGKELVSQAIHGASNRAGKKFVTVNCGAIPENLIESEFFGYQKGAFTGATADKKGFLEEADDGTLFLDEIGEISLNMQVKLLRAIEGGGFTPVGSNKLIKPNLRIIAATNRDPIELVKQGKMRSDFYFRIHVIPIHLPPLRDREDDIFHLVDFFLKKYSDTENQVPLSHKDLKTLKNYDWPGNVRELQNVLRRYIALNNLDFMGPSPSSPEEERVLEIAEDEIPDDNFTLNDAVGRFEKKFIVEILKKNRWQKGKTATVLDVSRKTLFRKMKQYEIL